MDASLHEDLKRWPFTIVHESGRPKVEVDFCGDRCRFSAEEIGALLLSRMKALAESALGVPIESAVVAVPANFCDAQRQAVTDAASLAGLHVLQLINEPTAVALALQRDFKGPRRTFLILDVGGGSVDASVVQLDSARVEVLSSSGTIHLGGQDFDARLVAHLAAVCRQQYDWDPRSSACAMQRLRSVCKEAKHALSEPDTPSVLVEVEALMPEVDFCVRVTKAEFEELCQDLFKAVLIPVRNALQAANMTELDVDTVLMLGGASKMPQLQKMMRGLFGSKEVLVDDTDELVAQGAAIQAANTNDNRRPLEVQDVAPWTVSIETPSGLNVDLVQRNAQVPCKKNLTLTVGHHLCHYIGRAPPSVKIYEEDRNGNKNLLGRLNLVSNEISSVNLCVEVDPSGLIRVTSKSGFFHKRHHLSPVEMATSKTRLDRIFVQEKLRKLGLAEKAKLEKFVDSVKEDIEKYSQKLTEADKEIARDVCNITEEWLKCSSSNAKDFEARCQERIVLMEKVLEPILAQVRALSNSVLGAGPYRRTYGIWHRSCAFQNMLGQDQPLDFSMI